MKSEVSVNLLLCTSMTFSLLTGAATNATEWCEMTL